MYHPQDIALHVYHCESADCFPCMCYKVGRDQLAEWSPDFHPKNCICDDCIIAWRLVRKVLDNYTEGANAIGNAARNERTSRMLAAEQAVQRAVQKDKEENRGRDRQIVLRRAERYSARLN